MQHARSSTDGNRARPMLCAIDCLLVWWCLRAKITTIAVDAVVHGRSPLLADPGVSDQKPRLHPKLSLLSRSLFLYMRHFTSYKPRRRLNTHERRR